jgi:hypothetical protein
VVVGGTTGCCSRHKCSASRGTSLGPSIFPFAPLHTSTPPAPLAALRLAPTALPCCAGCACRAGLVARPALREAHRARTDQGHRHLCGGGHGGGTVVRALPVAAAGHRGAADGRHERGGRPVWRRQDVPAPGESCR